jgi:DNA-binding transcriptional MerR regulator
VYAIGQASARTGVKIPTIRFYEQEGLLASPPRTEGGRRSYSDADVNRLTFIRHARALGFELDDIRSLLDLSDHPDRSCADADLIARKHLVEVEERLAQLSALKVELSRIVRSCAGGKAAQCRVIEALADHAHCGTDHASSHVKPRAKKKASAARAKARRT